MQQKNLPKIIWQTHEWQYNDLPYDYKMASLTWQNLNPDYEYRYVNAKEREDHIKQFDPDLFEQYQRCVGVTQADIWKQCILYLYGGFYSDLDSMCTMSIYEMDNLYPITKDFVCIPKMPNGKVMTGTFAAMPNNKISKKIIDNVFVNSLLKNKSPMPIFIGWEKISEEICKFSDDIDFTFHGVFHGGHVGEGYKYSDDFEVYVGGSRMTYKKFLEIKNFTN